MTRRVEWPTAGITGPGLWVSADRMTWQRMPDGLDAAARKAWMGGISWRVAEWADTPKDAVSAMRNGLDGLLKPRKAGAK